MKRNDEDQPLTKREFRLVIKELVEEIKSYIDISINVTKDELKEEIAYLKKDFGHLKEDFGHLKKDVGHLKKDVHTIKSDIVSFKDEILHELIAIREENAVLTLWNDSLEDHDKRITALETKKKN